MDFIQLMSDSRARRLLAIRRVPEPSIRLFCFPFAGGAASVFRQWPDRLPRNVEIYGVQFPGRGERFREKSHTRLLDLIDDLVGTFEADHDVPYAFFGHSMGALVAFAMTRTLRDRGIKGPKLMMVSGRRAPHRPDPDPPIHELPEPDFLRRIRELDGTPKAVFENAELLDLMIPILRADFEVCETYQFVDAEPLNCPIAAFGGIEDPDVAREDIEAWAAMTTSGFSMQMFRGGHFYLFDDAGALLHEITGHLGQLGPTRVERGSSK